jgi:hypothetical protein
MKKQFLFGICLMLGLSTCVFGVLGGGSGTKSDPYLISTADHLRLVTENDFFWSSHIKMIEGIDLEYKPIAHISIFSGVFDGDGHSILHFGNKETSWDPLPLFLNVKGGEIKNLTYIDPYIKCAPDSVYSEATTLSAYVRENSRIVNCHVINGHLEADPGTQENPGGNATGFIGTNEGSYISQCSFQGTVIGFQPAGFVGSNNMGTITDCYADIAVQGEQDASGFTAYNIGQISRCYTKGIVSSNYNSAGFVNSNFGEYDAEYPQYSFQGHISECSSFCSVYSALNMNTNAAGFAVMNVNGIIENSYCQGSVSGYWADGFAGLHSVDHMGTNAALINCYSSSYLTGTYKRGLVATRSGIATIQNCFWDTQTSGTSSSAGGVGKTTTQMQTQSTFTNWAFGTVWYMVKYPALRWEINPLQAQIDASQNGDVIVVPPGMYAGRLYFKGKNITLTSIDPTDPAVVASTVLMGRGIGSVVTFAGTENETCLLTGFTITNGYTTVRGGGIDGSECHASVRHCIIQDNTAYNCAGGGIWGIHGVIENCIARNNVAQYGGGIAKSNGIIKNTLIHGNTASTQGHALNNCDGTIRNCTIVAGNVGQQGLVSYCDGLFENTILSYSSGNLFLLHTAAMRYCCYSGAAGESNISTDPLFVDAANGDYHLLPDSPCIDAGDPASDYSNEPMPNGGRINMGAYGNTPEAALSRDGLVPLGFEIISKTRTGRTTFEYELAVIVQNTHAHAMEEVQLRLVDADKAVIAVSDDLIVMDHIGIDEIKTSLDTFALTIDRSEPIAAGRLTWELIYYVQGQAQPASLLTMPLGAIDPVPGDITGEGDVNFKDFAILASQWDQSSQVPSADIAPPLNGHVGMEDLLYLAKNWLQ